MLYIRSSDLIHFTTESLNHFNKLSLFLQPLATTLIFFLSLVCEFNLFKNKISYTSDIIQYYSMSGLFHLA